MDKIFNHPKRISDDREYPPTIGSHRKQPEPLGIAATPLAHAREHELAL